MCKPRISVIMSAYNAEKYICETIESVLSQSERSIEFIITDDNSSDRTVAILKGYKDPRICLIENKENKGLTRNLYHMVNISKGSYIARIDADDICAPNRLKIQADFLDEHDCGMVCSYANKIGDQRGLLKIPKNFEILKTDILFHNQIVHSSVMFKKSIGLNYNLDFKKAQDCELWDRIIAAGYKIGVIPKPLVSFRYHKQQISNVAGNEQVYYSNLVHRRQLERLQINPDLIDVYLCYINNNIVYNNDKIQEIILAFDAILSNNIEKGIYTSKVLKKLIKKQYVVLFNKINSCKSNISILIKIRIVYKMSIFYYIKTLLANLLA